MFDDIQDVVSESKEARASESNSLFGEAYESLGQQQYKSNDAMQASPQNDINQTFGTLELFDSQQVRTPTFQRDAPPPAPSAGELITRTIEEVPEQAVRAFGAIGHAWTHPGETFDHISEDARAKWSQISGS